MTAKGAAALAASPVEEITLPRRLLHPGQIQVAMHPARFKVLAAGRRWGKSKLFAVAGTLKALNGGRAWWIAPSYKLALIGWREMTRLARRVDGTEIYRSDFTIGYPSGGSVTIRSAHDPESLRSEGLDLALFDEAAFTNLAVAWTHSVRPALMDRHGSAWFGSTPFGQNEFWKLWKRGLNWRPGEEWASFRFNSWANPFIPADEQRAMREEYETLGGSDILAQETEAEFLAEAGAIFRGLSDVLRDDLVLGRDPHTGCLHAIGWDPAKFEDFNAVIVLDLKCREVCYLDRTRRIDLTVQCEKIAKLAKRYPGRVFLDATRDETLFELASEKGLAVEPVRFNAQNKQDMVNRLAVVIEKKRISIPRRGTEALIEELQSFRYQLSKWGGGVRFGAPAGEHDDTVTALGLCVLGMGDDALIDTRDITPETRGKRAVFMEGMPEDGRSVFS